MSKKHKHEQKCNDNIIIYIILYSFYDLIVPYFPLHHYLYLFVFDALTVMLPTMLMLSFHRHE